MKNGYRLNVLIKESEQLDEAWKEKVLYLCKRVKIAENKAENYKMQVRSLSLKYAHIKHYFARLAKMHYSGLKKVEAIWNESQGFYNHLEPKDKV